MDNMSHEQQREYIQNKIKEEESLFKSIMKVFEGKKLSNVKNALQRVEQHIDSFSTVQNVN